MTNFDTRIRLIYAPFLIVAFLFISIYSFLDWLLLATLDMPINEELVHLWLPLALPWVPVLIWLRPRIKLLSLNDKKGNLPFLYMFVVAMAIAVPTIFVQNFIGTAAGKLTVLDNIGQFDAKHLTKYYEFKTHHIDKNNIAIHRRNIVSGKNNEYLTYYIDIACPILSKPDSLVSFKFNDRKIPLLVVNGKVTDLVQFRIKRKDIISSNYVKSAEAIQLYGDSAKNGAFVVTAKNIPGQGAAYFVDNMPKAWLGFEFERQVSNNLSADAKDQEYRSFSAQSNSEFKTKNFDDFIYLDHIGVNDRRNAYTKAITGTLKDNTLKPVIFEAVNAPFEARNGNSLPWMFKSFGIGAAVWLLMIIIPRLKENEIEKLQPNPLRSNLDAVYTFFNVFKAQSKYQVTVIIVSLNLAVFLAMVFAGLGFINFESSDLLAWGANYRPSTTSGDWWRLLTCVFLHAGLMHLLLNMYGLWFVSIFLEPMLGKAKYAMAYLLCGVVASAASIWWHPNTVSIGASGAIFGLYGVLTALAITSKVKLKQKKPLLLFSLFFIVINLVMGLRGNIDNAAHIGGLISGLLLGFVLNFTMPDAAADEEENDTLDYTPTSEQ